MNKFRNQNEDLINESIRAREMLVIGADGYRYGIMSRNSALEKANDLNLDLVLVSPDSNPPVAKLLDYPKYRFEQQKRLKEAKKNQKIIVVKEIQLSFSIQQNDIDTKAKQARKFLEKGDKVKVTIRLNGRLISKQAIAKNVMEAFVASLADISSVESEVRLDGKTLITILNAKKENKGV